MNTKIGIFDSGIGGITVLRECIKNCPNFPYIYYSDSKNNPYGEKSKSELIIIVENVVKKLINMNCSIIIIACNTASGVCVEYLREKYKDIVFIATEPAIKLSYDKNNKETTLVMATKATLNSEKFSRLYNRFKDKKKYYLLECSGLADLIENGEEEKIETYLNKKLDKYSKKVGSVVLGCTHYPLIKDKIKKVLGDVEFYDGSIGISKQLEKLIKLNGVVEKKFDIKFIDSNNDDKKEKRFYQLLNVNHENKLFDKSE